MRIAGALIALIAGISAAAAAECGPDKLGTSRVAAVGTEGGLEVGLKTYPQTIPLADHEVILTFDDGPEATHSPTNASTRPSSKSAAARMACLRSPGAKCWTAIRSRTTPGRIRSRPCAT